VGRLRYGRGPERAGWLTFRPVAGMSRIPEGYAEEAIHELGRWVSVRQPHACWLCDEMGDAVTTAYSCDTVLWYERPAERWTEALPLGNGRLGAMVFGGAVHERVQLNEETVWTGGPYDPAQPGAADAVAEVRRLVFRGESLKAHYLSGMCRCPGGECRYGIPWTSTNDAPWLARGPGISPEPSQALLLRQHERRRASDVLALLTGQAARSVS
jgi:hypothetical protein